MHETETFSVPSEGEAPQWTSVMTDPNWTPESPNKEWERAVAVSWDTIGEEPPSLWPASEDNNSAGCEGPSDADIMAFLGLGKEAVHSYGDVPSSEEHEKVLSYLGISKTDKSSMLVTLGLDDTTTRAYGVDDSKAESLLQGGQQGEQISQPEGQTRLPKSTLNVAASPFCPARFTKVGIEEGPKLNPAAVPFIPGGAHSSVRDSVTSTSLKLPQPSEDGGDELARAQAAVRHYQNLFTSSKEELQMCNKMLQKEKEGTRKTHEALELKSKDMDRLRVELQSETIRTKQATDQVTALQTEMGYYKKLMEQIQGQIQITWAQFMSQLQQEKAARQAAEEASAQLQTALQLARLEAEQHSLKVAEQQSTVKEAQLLAQQHQERAEAKEKEANFYRIMYNTAVKQVESSQAAVRASIELEKQARQEAEARAELDAQDVYAIKQQVIVAKQGPQAVDLDTHKRSIDASREQQSA